MIGTLYASSTLNITLSLESRYDYCFHFAAEETVA